MDRGFYMNNTTLLIPADVPIHSRDAFIYNYNAITRNTRGLFLFTGDHKIEHTSEDFTDIEHLFRIAVHGAVGAFAVHPGLLARYAEKYPAIPYLAKLNAKTNLVPTEYHDPYSAPLASIEDIIALRKAHIPIHAVGYTIYLGSTQEEQMLADAAKVVFEAHKAGLIVVLWMYPRGHHVAEPHDPHLLAGAAGVAASLGADFVKLNASHISRELQAGDMREILQAAGNTKVLFAGGPKEAIDDFVTRVKFYLEHGAAGIAAGRNIYQHPFDVACALTDTLAELIYQ